MRFEIDGWLDTALRIPTRRVLPLVEGPLCLVWHTTDTVNANLRALCERVSYPPTAGQRACSWHLLVARDGTVYQLAPVREWGTWHVGRGGMVRGRRMAINAVSIGIELENAGRLKLTDRGYLAYPVWRDGDETQGLDMALRVPDAEVEHVSGAGYWHRFTDVQVAAAGDLLAALHQALPEITDREMARSHHEFDPDRKDDPGPLWMDQILPGLVGHTLSLGGTP